jgi:amino acid transporter
VLSYYLGWNVPWIIFSVLLTAGAVAMMIRGVAVSTRLAGFFFGFEMVVLVIVAVATLIKNGGSLSLAPFDPHHINGGFGGLAAGFPLAIYLFIGWENSAALAEETGNPRRNVPWAVFLSVAIMAAVNSQCRLVFNAGREGLLPRWIGKVDPVRRTPINAIFAFVGIASVIVLGWAIGHWAGGSTGSLNALNYFTESGTMGTILILVVYFLANLLPVQAGTAEPLQLVPVGGPGRSHRLRRLRRGADQARPRAGGAGRLDRGRRVRRAIRTERT